MTAAPTFEDRTALVTGTGSGSGAAIAGELARADTYVFGDALMATWGAVAEEEIALSILCTVVSRPTPERATVDGGSKTFAGDIAPGMVSGLTRFGRLVGAEAHIEGMTEEHGLVGLEQGVAPSIGERLGFVPNHVCTAVNLADEIIGVAGPGARQANLTHHCSPSGARQVRFELVSKPIRCV